MLIGVRSEWTERLDISVTVVVCQCRRSWGCGKSFLGKID